MLNRKILLLSLAFGIFLCFGTYLLQIFLLPNFVLKKSNIFEIKSTPYRPSNLEKLNNQFSLDAENSPTPPIPGVFTKGMDIQIYGTEGDGLRLREKPGMDKEVLFIAQEGAIYRIIEGPNVTDSFVWWKIQAKTDESKTGWSVQDYFLGITSN